MGKKGVEGKRNDKKKSEGPPVNGGETLPGVPVPMNYVAGKSDNVILERKSSTSSILPLMIFEYGNEPTRRASIQPDLPPIAQILPETANNGSGSLEAWSKEVQQHTKYVTYNTFTTSRKAKIWLYKNLVGVGLSFLLVFSAFQGLQNLQSSINAEGGLGLATLSIVYLCFTLAGFVTPGIIKLVGTKYALLGGFLCHLLYTVANYYPSWYTFVPASVLLGFASAPIWAAGSAHLVKISVIAAPVLGVDQSHLIGSMVATFFVFFQGAQIPGNLASSLILFPYSGSESNSSLDVGANSTEFHDECGRVESTTIDITYLYILSSVYFVMVALGIIVLLVMVNNIPYENETSKTIGQKVRLYFGDPLVALLKLLKDYRIILVIPMAFVNGLVQSFLFGTFTQIVIANCFGAYLVGFSIIVHGVTSALAGLVYSQLVKHIPWYSLYVYGGIVNISLVIFLLLWTITPSYVVVFTFVFLWGTADAVWNTITASVVGILFPKQSELAYSMHRIVMALGLGIGFVIGEFLSLSGRCYVVLTAVVIGVLTSIILEFKTQSKEDVMPCCFSKSSKFKVSKENEEKV